MNSHFMSAALKEAQKAALRGEIPVGAVIVQNGEIIAAAGNQREEKRNALSHAEIEAIRIACEKLQRWRLDDCELYVTLEPCPMCAGAILNARIKTVVFGAYDSRWGCADSVINLFNLPFDQRPEVYGGIREDECLAILQNFFKEIRHE